MQESVIYRSIQEETAAKAKRSIALNLLRAGVNIDLIAASTGLSIEEVQQLQINDSAPAFTGLDRSLPTPDPSPRKSYRISNEI